MTSRLTHRERYSTVRARSLFDPFCEFPNIANLPPNFPHGGNTKWLAAAISFLYLWFKLCPWESTIIQLIIERK